jgi:branched-chain amino acid transport system substrate-binding protein
LVRKTLVAVVALTGLLTAACGGNGGSSASGSASGSGSSSSADPLRILLITPLSSSVLGANATTSVNAAKAAIATINKNGGVLGHPVQLDVEDDAGQVTTAVTKLTTALNSSNKPAIVMQADSSTQAAALLPLTTQNKIVSFNQSPTADSSDPTKMPYNFDLSPSTANYAAAFCPEMKKEGAKTFGILHGDSAFADSETDEVAKQCQAKGLTLVGNEKFALTALDVTPQLSALKSKNPDVLMVSSFGAPSGYVLQGRDRLGWDVPIIGDNAFMVSPVVNTPPPTGQLGTSLENNVKALVFASTAYSKDQPQAVTDMIKDMKAIGPIPAPLIVAYSYDAMILAAEGAKAAGTTTDGTKIAKAIEGLQAGGPKTAIFPAYHFSTKSHAANIDPTAFAFVKPTKVVDGQFGAPGS